jgi:hypothetical protein
MLSRHWSWDQAALRSDLETLLQQLHEEKLIVPDVGTSTKGDLPPFPSGYETPELEIYRDMAALLALDPPMPRMDESSLEDA